LLATQAGEDDRIDRESCERACPRRIDVDDSEPHQSRSRIELGRQLVPVDIGPEQLFDQQLVDERAARIVRQDPVEARGLAPQRRCRDHHQEVECERRQSELSTERTESGARTTQLRQLRRGPGVRGEMLARRRDVVLGVAAAHPEQRGDLELERMTPLVPVSELARIPRAGDRL
jgi:hypothetical protein